MYVSLTLSDESVKVLIAGSFDSQITTADVVNGLIVDHEAAV